MKYILIQTGKGENDETKHNYQTKREILIRSKKIGNQCCTLMIKSYMGEIIKYAHEWINEWGFISLVEWIWLNDYVPY